MSIIITVVVQSVQHLFFHQWTVRAFPSIYQWPPGVPEQNNAPTPDVIPGATAVYFSSANSTGLVI